ncbi:MAG: VWA domain-containing protein [Candidatus Krumholzibacteriia bacterium]
MELARPWLLLLMLPLVVLLWWRLRRGDDEAAVRHANVALLPGSRGWRARLSAWLPAVTGLALLLLVVALSGPRLPQHQETVEGEGIDIVVALDISGSMRALDFDPLDRLAAAKEVIRDFVEGRPRDRMGLVLFAARAFTQCPLTLDHRVLLGFLDEVEVGLIDDGTAIGLGLATSVNRLKDSPAASKTVILLTDGMNNVPTLEPETAAELARTLEVRVYTVAIGREGVAPYPVDDPLFGRRTQPMETHIDEELLRRIAALTGGEMYRAQDPQALERIFATIDAMETSRYETTVSTYHRELVAWFAGPALVLLMLEALLGATWLRRLP